MERSDALLRIRALQGQDLRSLADRYHVTVWKSVDGVYHKNKGWPGHVVERYLGLALNSSRSPNFGSWELKVVPLRYRRDGSLTVKETMAITMIDPVEVRDKEFEESHLYNKLRKQIVVSRIFQDVQETSSLLHAAAEFDLDDPLVYATIKADYDLIRQVIKTTGFSALTGKMGQLIQPRTKGAGHGSVSRAFYARTALVAHILSISRLPFLPPVSSEG